MNRPVSILLVEDSNIMRKMEVEMLMKLGYPNIVEAVNGRDALLKLDQNKDISLIICDWNMPGLNGYELLVQVKSDPATKDIPFIMATARAEKRQAARAKAAGVDGFITKPFDFTELKDLLDDLLHSKEEKVSFFPENEKEKTVSDGKKRIRVAHIQITDHLILGVLKHRIGSKSVMPKYFDLETHCMPGWNPVQYALEKARVDAAFILAPMAMDLFSFNVPIKLALFTHKNGSACIRSSETINTNSLYDTFFKKTFFIPHILSIHHMLAHMFLTEVGLNPGVVGDRDVNAFFEVIPPIKMPHFLKHNRDVSGFLVAEPIPANTLSQGDGEIVFYSADIWERHPCCVLVMRQELIDEHPDAAFEFVDLLVDAGQYTSQNPGEAAKIAVDFLDPAKKLGLNEAVIKKVLTDPNGITTRDLFPVIEDLDRIQQYMVNVMGIGENIDVEDFVDLRFARYAFSKMQRLTENSVFLGPENVVSEIPDTILSKNRPGYNRPWDLVFRNRESAPNEFETLIDDNEVTFIFSSGLKMMERAIEKADDFFNTFGPETFSDAKMVIREMLLNAIEHGNDRNPEKKVVLTIKNIRDMLFQISVTDEGAGFDHENLEISLLDKSRQFNPSGFSLIGSLCEQIGFNSSGNQVTVYIRNDPETRFEIEEDQDTNVIRPSGNITAAVADRFRLLLIDLVEKGGTRFRFDFQKVEDIDSITLSVFVVFARMMSKKSRDAQLEIVNAGSDLVNLFKITRLDSKYEIFSAQSS